MRRDVMKTDAEIFASASVVGGKESEGPLGNLFDLRDQTDRFGMKTWEKSESEMQRLSLNTALAKGEVTPGEVDVLFAGDLLNQCVGSAYGLQDFGIPYIGLYGACSTCAEGLLLSSLFASYGMCKIAATVTSSHYCSAERQYRTPLEYGGQRPPTGQWTVTGAGAFAVSFELEDALRAASEKDGYIPEIGEVVVGRIIDAGITDSSNMGAAMAPAAADTIARYLQDTGTTPQDYDLIATGGTIRAAADLLKGEQAK